jgi:hypothetical protein
MPKRSKRRKLKIGTRDYGKPKQYVSLPQAPWGGDHGTGTAAANENTVLEPLVNEDGKNPNNMGRRKRVCFLETLTSLSMRQMQAAQEIMDAYSAVESLSSGSPLKEQVDSSPKPDAVITAQIEAHSRLSKAMEGVLRSDRLIVEHICWRNKKPQTLTRTQRRRWLARFTANMERVADILGY